MVTPTGAASATASPGRCEHARESSHPERRCRLSSGRERSRSGGKHGRDRSPSPARSARSVSVSASSSSESSDIEERVSAMPSPPAGHPGVGGSRRKGDRSASGCDRSPQPGPSGLVRSRLGYNSHSSPTPSGVVEATAIVPLVRSIWIRMIRLGLFFASSGSSIAWRNRQV